MSPQQIRNYLELGVLPPAARTPGGHRVFGARHVAALTTARRMAAGHGWAVTRRVLGAVHDGDVAAALAELDRAHAELDRERAELREVTAAFETVTATPVTRGPRRIGEVAHALGVRTSALRVWEREGMLRPDRERGTGYRVYDAGEQRIARAVAVLRRGGCPLPMVRAVIAELRRSGNPERVRAALDERRHRLTARSLRRLDGTAAAHAYLTGAQVMADSSTSPAAP